MRRILRIIKGLWLIVIVDTIKDFCEFYGETFKEIIAACEKRVAPRPPAGAEEEK